MDLKTLYKVVIKLVGPIEPVGETHTDDKRFENLKIMKMLTARLLEDIDEVAEYKDNHQYSMKRAGRYAGAFINGLKDIED